MVKLSVKNVVGGGGRSLAKCHIAGVAKPPDLSPAIRP